MTFPEKIENSSIRLWNKLYLTTIGLFGTVGCMFGLLYIFQTLFGFGYILASFVTFFIIVFLRGLFDSIIIRNIPLKHIQLEKFLVLALKR